MKKYFSIGETAKINNLSVQALRYYDKMGLLKPAYVDPESNYRYYTISQFMYIDLIKYFKQIGAPLKELSDILYKNNIVTFLSFIKKQQDNIEKEISRLKNLSNAIRLMEDNIKYALELKDTNQIYFRNIEKRSIIDIELNKKDKENDIEIKLRKMDKVMEENKIIFGGESGCLISTDLLLHNGEISYKNLYSTIYVGQVANINIDIKEIPTGKYICIAYLNDNREDAVAKVQNYLKENNIETLDVGVEVQLFNTLEQLGNEDYLYELQILIKNY